MNQINPLIEKYFAGETSLAEERQLRDYFNQPDVAEHLHKYQPLFQAQVDIREVAIPEFDFSFATEETPAPRTVSTLRRLPFYLSRIAALLVIAASVWWAFQPEEIAPIHQPQAINWEQYEVDNPEQALEETRAALKILSAALGKSRWGIGLFFFIFKINLSWKF